MKGIESSMLLAAADWAAIEPKPIIQISSLSPTIETCVGLNWSIGFCRFEVSSCRSQVLGLKLCYPLVLGMNVSTQLLAI